jgi:hypothetical protein
VFVDWSLALQDEKTVEKTEKAAKMEEKWTRSASSIRPFVCVRMFGGLGAGAGEAGRKKNFFFFSFLQFIKRVHVCVSV